ncbi:MAG: hypothetical protein DRJ50_06935 [Actinobacteria bacterium]|nr:MAG: hypothetical protein DRJ50_06935 [Actinomycetota bacterium]
MALTATPPSPVDTPLAQRLAGPDVVRAVALIGVVVMNYHGYLALRQGGSEIGTGWAAELFNPWTGPLSTRFAATFVLVAGVGVTLLTRRSLSDPVRVREMRWRLVRRGVLLYTGGLLIDEIWPGTILPYYGAMFAIAAALFTLRSRWIALIGLIAALAGWVIRVWRFEQQQDGLSTSWLTSPGSGSIRHYAFGSFVNGTHPLLPWLVFLCAGMLLGRVLNTNWWRIAALGSGFVLFAGANILSSAGSTRFQTVLLSSHPGDRGLVFVASALGTALIAYASIDWLSVRFPVAVDPLRRAGQLTLSLYLAHIFVFNLVVDWFGWVEPAGLDTALAFALAFWVIGIIAAVEWSRRFGRGPAERLYRAFGG